MTQAIMSTIKQPKLMARTQENKRTRVLFLPKIDESKNSGVSLVIMALNDRHLATQSHP